MAIAPYQTIAQGSPGRAGYLLRGVTFPVFVNGPNGPLRNILGLPAAVTAQWDSGSQVSSVDAAILAAVGAPQVGSVSISTVQGNSIVPSDMAQILLAPGTYPLSGGNLPVLADSLPSSVRVLIGREVQSMYRITIDGPAGTWTLEAPAGSAVVPRRRVALPLLLALGGAAALAVAALN